MGHQCQKKELSVLFIDEEEEDTDRGTNDPPLSPIEEITSEVSLNSVIGLSNPKNHEIDGSVW